jgi:endonuclease III
LRIATSLCASARQIRDEWDGSVETMWGDCPLAETLVARLKSLHGVGDKIGNLTARCLLLDFRNVTVWSGLSFLRPSPDRHVMRVFYRLGLIASEQDIKGLYEASERIRPTASVECDGAWALGMSNCIAGGSPLCERNPEGKACPLRRYCSSRR